MAVNSVTSSQVLNDADSVDGIQHGSLTTSKQAFFGSTPIVQPSGAAQGVITDSSGGAAAPTTGVAALTGTYNSTILANALATIIAQNTALRLALVNLGLIKGGA